MLNVLPGGGLYSASEFILVSYGLWTTPAWTMDRIWSAPAISNIMLLPAGSSDEYEAINPPLDMEASV